MKKILVLFIVVFFGSASFLIAEELSPEGAIIPSEKFVIVLNPDGVDNTDRHFKQGDVCNVCMGDRIEIVGILDPETNGWFLVRYSRTNNDTPARGEYCPDGVLTTVPTRSFYTMTAQFIKRLKILQTWSERVKEILAEKEKLHRESGI
jgi:hypothetical protein